MPRSSGWSAQRRLRRARPSARHRPPLPLPQRAPQAHTPYPSRRPRPPVPPPDPTAARRALRRGSRFAPRASSCAWETRSGFAPSSSTRSAASRAHRSSGPSARCGSRTGKPTRRRRPSTRPGKLSVPGDCADATFDVVATAAGRSARSSVDVTSPATYEALLAQSGLGPSGRAGRTRGGGAGHGLDRRIGCPGRGRRAAATRDLHRRRGRPRGGPWGRSRDRRDAVAQGARRRAGR